MFVTRSILWGGLWRRAAGPGPTPPSAATQTILASTRLLHGRIFRFSLDALVNIAAGLGRKITGTLDDRCLAFGATFKRVSLKRVRKQNA